jgi:GTPase SAR1 family protein
VLSEPQGVELVTGQPHEPGPAGSVISLPERPGRSPALGDCLFGVADILPRLVSDATPAAWPPDFADLLQTTARHGPELLVPVIAPAKAGKSTLINAVLGDDVLPAHPLPTTCLPTRVVFGHPAAGLEPVLELGRATTLNARSLVAVLQKVLTGVSRDHPPQTEGLVERLRRNETILFPHRCRGTHAVRRVLAELNNLVRLAVQVLPDEGIPVPPILPPEVYAPRDCLPFHFAPAPAGIPVVLVDMPGSDDATMVTFAGEQLAEQLRRAHAVIAVVDYSRLANQAANEINQVLRSSMDVLGPAALRLVVNRVDQRRRDDDLDTEGVRALVTHALGLDDQTRIVEVSAEQGLAARRYQKAVADIEQDQRGTRSFDRAATALLRTIYPAQWRGRNTTPGQLTGLADRLHANSGMPELFADLLTPLCRDAVTTSWRATLARLEAGMSELATSGSDLTEFTDRVADLAWCISRLGAASYDR